MRVQCREQERKETANLFYTRRSLEQVRTGTNVYLLSESARRTFAPAAAARERTKERLKRKGGTVKKRTFPSCFVYIAPAHFYRFGVLFFCVSLRFTLCLCVCTVSSNRRNIGVVNLCPLPACKSLFISDRFPANSFGNELPLPIPMRTIVTRPELFTEPASHG